MSSGFTDKQRDEIRRKLLDAGIEIAVKAGFKKMTVALVAKAAGVAVGTFYNFFDSKESFAEAMLMDSEAKAYEALSSHFTDGTIDLKGFMKAFRDNFRPENNFWLNLRLDDWVWLKTHITDGSFFTNEADMKKVRELIPHITGIRKDADLSVVANFIKAIYAMYQNRDTLFEESLQTNVDLLFDSMYRYLKA